VGRKPGRTEGVRKIAVGTVQRISRPFEASASVEAASAAA